MATRGAAPRDHAPRRVTRAPPFSIRFRQREIELGRAAGRDLHLDLPGVGKLHCTFLVTSRGEVLLRDHYSLNGTRINGRTIRDTALVLPGDRVGVSDARLTLETPPRPLNDAAWRRWQETREEWRKRRPEFELSDAEAPDFGLRATFSLSERGGGESRTVTLGCPHVTIGRARSNHIVLPAANVSKHHAELSLDEAGVVTLRDLGSCNGTSVDGVELGDDAIELERGQTVRIGDFDLVLEVIEEK